MRILYTPCLLMSPDLRLRLHATQAQPCFPAASNALALPGGNGIFTATPAERITHYTLLRKVVCQMGALPPLETPTRKGGTLPLHGAHTAFSCYPALRLYRLSKSPRGIDVVSLTLGNSALPFGNRFIAHAKFFGKLFLGHSKFFSFSCNVFSDFNQIHIHPPPLFEIIISFYGIYVHPLKVECVKSCRNFPCAQRVCKFSLKFTKSYFFKNRLWYTNKRLLMMIYKPKKDKR